MKKQIIFAALTALSICMTACGNNTTVQSPAANTVAVSEITTSAAAATTVLTAAPATESAAVSSAQTTASVQTTAAQTAAAQTAAGTKAAPAKKMLDESNRLFGGYVSTKNNANLNLRLLPDESSDVLAKIPYATQIDVYACGTTGWYMAQYMGKTGYVSAAYVKKIEDCEQQSGSTETKLKVKDLVGYWNYRSAGGTDISAVSIFEDGSYLNLGVSDAAIDEYGTVQIIADGGKEWITLVDSNGKISLRFTADPQNAKEYIAEGASGNRLINATGYTKPNADGFYDDNNLPATSVSVAALNGTWEIEQKDVTLIISSGSDIYHGKCELIDQGGVTHNGNVQIQYLLNQSNQREYCFTFYEDNGSFLFAFGLTDTIQCSDLYGYQSGEPHFIRQAN